MRRDDRGPPDAHPGRVRLIEWIGTVTNPIDANSAVGSKVQKLPLRRIDLGEICPDEVIAAALASHHLKTTVLLLRACRCVWRAGKNCCDIVVKVRGRELNNENDLDPNARSGTASTPMPTPRGNSAAPSWAPEC
jgi:hypothetical protein